MDLFETSKPKTNSKHHKSSHKTSKSQWVYFDRYRILPKPLNDFLNSLKLPRFYYLTLRDWTIVQALQIPVAIGIGLALIVPLTIVVTIGAFLFALALPIIIPAVLIATIFIATISLAAPAIMIVAGLLGVGVGIAWSIIGGFLYAWIFAGVSAVLWTLGVGGIAGLIAAVPNFAILLIGIFNPAGIATSIPAFLLAVFDVAATAIIAGFIAFLISAFLTYWFYTFWISFFRLFFWIPVLGLIGVAFGAFAGFVIATVITIVTIPVVLLITALIALPAMALAIVGIPLVLTVVNIIIVIVLVTGFIRSLRKPGLLTKHALDKARKSGRSHHKSNSHGKSKSHTSRHKVSAVKQVVVDYSQVSGVNDPNVSNLVQLNQTNTATNLGNANMFGLVRVPVVLLSNVENLLSIPNTVTPTLLKQQDTSGGDNTVCTPSGLVGITCTQVSPTVNENINSAVEEQTQVLPQTTTTTTTNTDGTTTKTTTVDKNKPPKVVPKKVWPLPTTGLMSRIDYFALQNRATGRHNNLVNTMDALYGTRRHPGPLRPIAEATAGLVDNI